MQPFNKQRKNIDSFIVIFALVLYPDQESIANNNLFSFELKDLDGIYNTMGKYSEDPDFNEKLSNIIEQKILLLTQNQKLSTAETYIKERLLNAIKKVTPKPNKITIATFIVKSDND